MHKPYIISVMAADEGDAIGKEGGLPWRLPDDLKRFKAHTVGMPIVMGRRTWLSFGGKPLPRRRNIVVSRTMQPAELPEGVELAESWEAALALCQAEPRLALIGGAQLLAQGMPDVDELILTRIHARLDDADTFLPAWPIADFEPAGTPLHHPIDARHAFAFTEVRWVRRK